MMNKPEKLGAEHYRAFLSRQGRAFYDCINAQLLRGDHSGKTALTISDPQNATSDCFAAYKAIRDDHPEYFYLGFQCEFIHRGRSGTLSYPILYAADIIARVRRQLDKHIEAIVRGTEHLPLLAREIIVYERIAKKLSYADHSDVRDHNIVGPILLSSGVCEGHNALLLLCLRRIGIPCIKVYGRTETDGWHCWTVAWINGIPVHCDVTWDCSKGGTVHFNYLNLSDRQISGDHFQFKSPSVPECPSDSLSYYRRRNLCVASFRDLCARLRADAKAGVSPSLLHFDYQPPSGDYVKELQRALSAAQIYGRHKFHCRPSLKNFAVESV